jgi:DNA adenine methylase
MTKLESVFPYPGGKRKLAQRIVDEFKSITSKGKFTYAELCVGGGAVLCELVNRHMPERIVVNDKSRYMAAFWKCVRDAKLKDELVGRIRAAGKMKPTELVKEFKRLKPMLESTETIEAAYAGVIRGRTAFGGIIVGGGPYGGHDQDDATGNIVKRLRAETTIRRIEALHERIGSRLEVFNDDASTVVKRHDAPQTIIYLDPPYVSIQTENDVGAGDETQLYVEEMDDSTHERLADAVESVKRALVVVSYNDHPWVRDLYLWADVREIRAPYSLGKSREGKLELLITNRGAATEAGTGRKSREVRVRKLLAEAEAILDRCEGAFREAGKTLADVRDRRLYRPTYSSFEDYCTLARGYGTRDYAYKVLAAARAAAIVDKSSTPEKPRNEAQVRPLTLLMGNPEQMVKAWALAVARKPKDAKHVPSRIVAAVVSEMLLTKPVINALQQLLRKKSEPLISRNPSSLRQGLLGIDFLVRGLSDVYGEVVDYRRFNVHELRETAILAEALGDELQEFGKKLEWLRTNPGDAIASRLEEEAEK